MNQPALLLLGLLVVGLLFVLLRGTFNRQRRAQRRRDRSHRPVISSRQGPSVRLAVKVDKPDRKRER